MRISHVQNPTVETKKNKALFLTKDLDDVQVSIAIRDQDKASPSPLLIIM